MAIFISCKMGDVVSLEQGLAINKKSKHLLVESGYPLLRITDMIHQKFAQFIDAVKIPQKFVAKDNDLIFSRTGQVGLIFRNQTGVIHNNCFRITPSDKLDRGFLYWFLKQEKIKVYINTLASGSAQPDLNHDAFKSVPVNFPECLEEQKKIANIFDEYDNLIENNNRRIVILENMAQSLYREWFVNFRYPSHADAVDDSSPNALNENQGKAKFIDSTLGKIPEGWEVKRLDEVADVNPQSITKKNAPESIGYIDIKSVGSGIVNEVKPMQFKDAPSRAKRIVVDGDIIWATVRPNRKQFSFICKPSSNTIASTGFAVIRSKNVPASYMYSFTTTDAFASYLVNHATGSAYPAVNSDIFKKANVLVPPSELLEKFDELCLVTMQQSEVLKKKNENLKKQRDMLLPKLISGKINLNEAN